MLGVGVLGFCARTPLTLVRVPLRLGRLGGTASLFAGTGGFSCHLFCVWLGFPRVFDLVLILFTAPLLSGFCRNPVWRSKRTAACARTKCHSVNLWCLGYVMFFLCIYTGDKVSQTLGQSACAYSHADMLPLRFSFFREISSLRINIDIYQFLIAFCILLTSFSAGQKTNAMSYARTHMFRGLSPLA